MKVVLIILTLFPIVALAQSARLSYADKMFDQKRFYYAAEGYEDVLERGVNEAELARKLALSYFYSRNYSKSLEWFRFMYNEDLLKDKDFAYLIYLFKWDGRLDKALDMANLYKEKYGDNDDINEFIINYDLLNDLSNNERTDDFEILKIDSLFKACDSPNNQISSSYFTEDSLIIISNERLSYLTTREHAQDRSSYYHIFTGVRDSSGLISDLNLLKIDTTANFNVSHVFYDRANKKVFFSANKLGKRRLNVIPEDELERASSDSSKVKNALAKTGLFFNNFSDIMNVGIDRVISNEDDILPMRIYSADFDGNKLSNLVELPIGTQGIEDCSYPSISHDGEYIYFSANLPGGFGGMDIYRAKLIDSGRDITEITNLGKQINSSSNEIYPHVKSENNVVYFSSNGNRSMGGYDLFAGLINSDGIGIRSLNLGKPINSSKDEFSFVNNANQDFGYVSTNNYDTTALANEFLVAFKQNKVYKFFGTISGSIKDITSGSSKSNILLNLVDEDGKILDSIRTDEDGNYELGIYEEIQKANVVVAADNYYEESSLVTLDPKKTKYENVNFTITPRMDYHVEGMVYGADPENVNKIYPLPNTQIDVISKSQDTLLTFISDVNGDFKSEILPNLRYGMNVDYIVAFSKKGFTNEKYIFNAPLTENPAIVISDTLNPVKLYKIGFGTDIENIVILKDIYFDYDKSDIRPDASLELDKVLNFMKNNPEVVIEVRSHTDSRGGEYYNLLLSDRRAQSSREYLIINGIPSNKVKSKAFGESKLKVSQEEIDAATAEEQEEMQELNRRTEFIIVE